MSETAFYALNLPCARPVLRTNGMQFTASVSDNDPFLAPVSLVLCERSLEARHLLPKQDHVGSIPIARSVSRETHKKATFAS